MIHSNVPKIVLILAGGLGSRYAGSKQVDGIGPNGEFLLEYTLYDALKAGFDRAVIIVNSSVQKTLSSRLRTQFPTLDVTLIEQKTESVERKKPWGTGHAVLSAKGEINGPFMVLNADDYYGQSTFELANKCMSDGSIDSENMGLVTFQLGRTLSEHGGVSRGICQVDSKGNLKAVEEHEGILIREGNIYSNQSPEIRLEEDAPVSMNCWLLDPSIFNHLQKGFDSFYAQHMFSLREEYYLPSAVQELVTSNGIKFRALNSNEQWFGLTYAEDKETARKKIALSIEKGMYPKKLNNG